ncbi:MAG: metallophosphoesterase, partial [Pseudomonadota bacterium]
MAKRPSKYAYVNAITWPWHSGATSPEQHVWLRILGTTDIHGHILPYDYANDTLVDGFGFARVASHIRVARSEARNTLLFDNGDFLQGSPLTDIGARPENGWTGANPVLEVMNHVAYDAATIGNHEFNFGLEWLLRTLDESKFPLVCANAVLARHPDNPVKDQTLLPPFILLDRVFWDSSGTPQPLKIGVIGVLPPQILQWDRDNLAGRLEVRDMVETLKAYVPVLRNAGAQIVIVLAHSGIGEDDIAPGQENAGLALAQVPGVDAILTGHTHNLFPDQIAKPQNPKINSVNGTLAGVPSVMAGFRGSHLGVIDLKLAPRSNGWQISSHASEIWSVRTAEIEQDKAISVLVNAAHQATLRHTSQLVGQTNIPIHSYLSQFRPDPAQYLIMACKRAALTKAL